MSLNITASLNRVIYIHNRDTERFYCYLNGSVLFTYIVVCYATYSNQTI